MGITKSKKNLATCFSTTVKQHVPDKFLIALFFQENEEQRHGNTFESSRVYQPTPTKHDKAQQH